MLDDDVRGPAQSANKMENGSTNLLGTTLDGWRVRDAQPSHVDAHGVREFATEALSELRLGPLESTAVFTVHFQRIVGTSRCVETSADDEIFFAVRRPRTNLSRLVHRRFGSPTDAVTLVLTPLREPLTAVCLTAYLGPPAPPEPTDAVRVRSSIEYQRAYEFWMRHALTVVPNEIDESTITTSCPWAAPQTD